MPRTLGALLAFVLVSTVAARAQPTLGPDLEREARQLETMLVAPCCWSQQVSVHQSPAADEMKKDIRRRLTEGKTRQQILDAYVVEFGERILIEPPARGFKRTLYVLPIVLLVLSAAVLSVIVKRMSRAPALAAGPAGGATDTRNAYDERLNDELRDLD